MLKIVNHYFFGDLCSMVELSDGRKLWTADDWTVITDDKDKYDADMDCWRSQRVVNGKTIYYEQWDLCAGFNPIPDWAKDELYTKSKVKPVEMPPEMVLELRGWTDMSQYWKYVDESRQLNTR